MLSITELVESKGYKNFMRYVYGWGASVVLIGALFKIQHLPGAAIMLTIGLLVEALIFFFSAFEPLHEELDWTLVYPELAGLSDEFEEDDQVRKFDRAHDIPQVVGVPVGGAIGDASLGMPVAGGAFVGGGSTSALAKFDQMLVNAEIGPELFERLSAGLNNLSESASKLTDLSNTGIVAKEFADRMASASNSVAVLDDTYKKSSEVLKESVSTLSDSYIKTAETFNKSSEQLSSSYTAFANKLTAEIDTVGSKGSAYAEKLGVLNTNLATLNTSYELQIQNSKQYIESAKEYYIGMDGIAQNLTKTVENTAKLNDGVQKLEQNVASLNSIYGNMLSSLNFK